MSGPQTPRSLEMERRWLSMMNGDEVDEEDNEQRFPFEEEVAQFTSCHHPLSAPLRKKTKDKMPSPRHRNKKTPSLTPRGIASSQFITNTGSWWSFGAKSAETPEDALEAASGVSDSNTEKRKEVRFDESVNLAKKKVVSALKQKTSVAANSAGVLRRCMGRGPPTIETSKSADSFLDIIQDRLCNYDASSALYKWEEEMEEKIILNNPALLGFVEPPLSWNSEDDDDDDDSSEPSSPASSQSFDEVFAENDVQPAAANQFSCQADTIKREKVAKKVKKLIDEKNNNKSRSSKKNRKSPSPKPWESTTKIIGRIKTPKEHSRFTDSQKAAVEASPASILLSSKKKNATKVGSARSPSEETHRTMVENKYKLLTKIHDNNDTAGNGDRDDGDDDDDVNGRDTAELTDDEVSAKENGRPSSRLFGFGRGGSRSRSKSRSRSRSRSRGRQSQQNISTEIKLPTAVPAAAWVAQPATIVSGLTETEDRHRHNAKHAPLLILPDETESKACTLPVLQQKFMNRKITQSKSLDRSLDSTILDRPPLAITTKNVSKTDTASEKDLSLYDYGSYRQAYVAYFHRGPVKPTKTIRLYEHSVPPVFPMLDCEVVVKVEYSTVTETDCAVRRGMFWEDDSPNPLNMPIVPGVAFYGQIIQIDKTSSRSGLKKGDAVTSLVRVGANSRHLCIGYDRLVKVPKNIRDPATVACMPEVYLSAFQALHIDQRSSVRHRKNALSGKAILIIGGTTKVGRALIELSLAAGSETVYATAREKSFKLIEEAGGIPLNKDIHYWYSILAGKMDIVVCVESHDRKQHELKYEHIQTLNKHGKVILMCGPEDESGKVAELSKYDEQSEGTARKLHNYNVFHSWEANMKQAKRDLAHLLKLLSEDVIMPKIFEKIPLTKVGRAQQVIDKTPMSGFVLCEPWLKLDKGSTVASLTQTNSTFETTSWSHSAR